MGTVINTSNRIQEHCSAGVTRRRWLLHSASLGIAAGLLGPRLSAQEDLTASTLRSMSWMTGSELPDAWVQPTAGLVKVILDDSRSLRELDLGEIEPATIFSAR